MAYYGSSQLSAVTGRPLRGGTRAGINAMAPWYAEGVLQKRRDAREQEAFDLTRAGQEASIAQQNESLRLQGEASEEAKKQANIANMISGGATALTGGKLLYDILGGGSTAAKALTPSTSLGPLGVDATGSITSGLTTGAGASGAGTALSLGPQMSGSLLPASVPAIPSIAGLSAAGTLAPISTVGTTAGGSLVAGMGAGASAAPSAGLVGASGQGIGQSLAYGGTSAAGAGGASSVLGTPGALTGAGWAAGAGALALPILVGQLISPLNSTKPDFVQENPETYKKYVLDAQQILAQHGLDIPLPDMEALAASGLSNNPDNWVPTGVPEDVRKYLQTAGLAKEYGGQYLTDLDALGLTQRQKDFFSTGGFKNMNMGSALADKSPMHAKVIANKVAAEAAKKLSHAQTLASNLQGYGVDTSGYYGLNKALSGANTQQAQKTAQTTQQSFFSSIRF